MKKMKEEHTPQEITEQIRRYTDAYIKQVINFSQKGYFRVKQKHKNHGIKFEPYDENIGYHVYIDDTHISSRKILVENAVIGIDSDELYEALLILTEKQRAVLIKNVVLDMPISLIAKQMGIRENKVYKHRDAALKKIRRHLDWDKE